MPAVWPSVFRPTAAAPLGERSMLLSRPDIEQNGGELPSLQLCGETGESGFARCLLSGVGPDALVGRCEQGGGAPSEARGRRRDHGQPKSHRLTPYRAEEMGPPRGRFPKLRSTSHAVWAEQISLPSGDQRRNELKGWPTAAQSLSMRSYPSAAPPPIRPPDRG